MLLPETSTSDDSEEVESIEDTIWRDGSSLKAGDLRLDVTLKLDATQDSVEITNSESEVALFSLASVNQNTAPSVEVPWSQLLALSMSSRQDPPVLTVGRHRQCNVQLKDPRVSLRHFEIVAHKRCTNDVQEVTYDCLLNDLSSNGTTINGKIVGKGRSNQLRSGDEISVLTAGRVGEDKKIAFIFRNTTEALHKPEAEATEEFKLGELVTCPICMLTIHRCVAMSPCLHNFCAACCSDWLCRSFDCPVCRQAVDAVIKNRAMDEVIEAVVERHKELRRCPSEQREMDRRDKLNLRQGVLMKTVQRPCPTVQQRASRPEDADEQVRSRAAPRSVQAPRGRSAAPTAVADVREGSRARQQNCAVQ